MKPDVAEKKASDAAFKYSQRQMRYRAQMIADTEMAMAYNYGYHESVRQAIRAGEMGEVIKIWSAARDERTCPRCAALNGKKVGFEDTFDFGTGAKILYPGANQTPPAHPKCRCAVLYEEVSEPPLTPKRYQDNIKIKEPIKPDKVVEKGSAPLEGEPNTVVDFYPNKKGFKRVFYGADGRMTKELHPNGHASLKDHPYGNDGEHMHDYVWFAGRMPPLRFIRDLTELERAQNSEIIGQEQGDDTNADTNSETEFT